LIDKYALSGEVAVIDMDASRGTGNNQSLIETLIAKYPCRIGGNIRTAADAIHWLDAGAEKVIVDDGVDPTLFSTLPSSRILAAVDVESGDAITAGGSAGSGPNPLDRINALKDHVGGIVVNFHQSMGSDGEIDMLAVKILAEATGSRTSLTVAGGIGRAKQVADIDALGVDAQVGSALHNGTLNLADGIVAPIKTDRPDGLFTTVVVDELGQAIGLVYSDMESIREAVKRKMGAYHSRSRGLWVKGLTSGNTQALLGIRLDCDRDALYFMVTQTGAGFCHNDTWSCWGDDKGIGRLFRLVKSRSVGAPDGSYTKRLFDDPALLKAKLVEEAGELADATEREAVVEEAADVLYFTLTAMAKAGVSFKEVEETLYKRSLRVTRRGGDAKPKRS
jgi:phosphoribosyl-ATP pyrophosphohydrolase